MLRLKLQTPLQAQGKLPKGMFDLSSDRGVHVYSQIENRQACEYLFGRLGR